MICPHCRAENPTSNWYCLNCGKSLRSQAKPDTTATPGKTPGREQAPQAAGLDTGPEEGETMFAGRYADLVEIGDGAMATVFRARDTALDQNVALKVLHSDLAANEQYIARFKREIALARTITHPNVYRIYDIGQSDDVHFISMEYIDGQELKSILGKKPPGLAKGIRIVRQICLALAQAHSEGVIHRDLKPQNIMIEKKTRRCVVMDFGIAIGETSSAITQTGAFVGTPEYISPEQANGLDIDQTTDIYSLGIIMYEMFTGKLPFGPGKPLTVALQHIKETPLAPRKLKPALSRELEAIILKAMAKEKEHRYPDALSLLTDLDTLLAGKEESARENESVSLQVPALAQTGQNPYLNRNMIRDTRLFFGRKKEIATIYSRLGAARPQSVSIVGERRIGKSSLLYHINQESSRRAYLKESTSYIFIFVDFQEKRRVSVQEFLFRSSLSPYSQL